MPLFMYRITLKSSKKEGVMDEGKINKLIKASIAKGIVNNVLDIAEGLRGERKLTKKEINDAIKLYVSNGWVASSEEMAKLREEGKLTEPEIDRLIEICTSKRMDKTIDGGGEAKERQ